MSARYAFVTLLTSDDYLPGALTVAAALQDVHHSQPPDQYETACLVTPETVDVSSIKLLRKAFNVVIGVEVIAPPDTESLTLLGRPDLGAALTKLHVFRLTKYSKVIFLDADVLPLRPLSHLFHLGHDFSAVPDVGWPDIFNSGVMVLSPCEDNFKQLQGLLNTKGSWDGADQGILNEWRGNNWNRLSFTYNTTPTSIYTYAPAYQRFGSQISVIHFIGPHKPWHSIPYRAPRSYTQPADMAPSTGTHHSRTFDYGSLVDHWYSVYDRHYRSQSPEPDFKPTRYTSAWNEEIPRRPDTARGTLGLEELRRVALEGMATSGILAPRVAGEGEYRTMPLEGRFHLVRPRTRAERTEVEMAEDHTETAESTPVPTRLSTTPEPSTPPEQILSLPSGSPVRWMTLPTPGINEIPPAPHARPVSLPPTPLHYVPAPYKPLRITREVGAQTVPIRPQQVPGRADLSLTPNTVAKTPPNVVAPAPTDTYFPKVRDIDRNWSSVSPSTSETSLTTLELSPSRSKPTTDAFFSSPTVAVAPVFHNQWSNRNIIGEETASSTPDLRKVKHVFPWEEHPRHPPRRVFPNEIPPLIAARRPPATPERKATSRPPMPSPLVGFPPAFRPHYPPDSPIPQKHAGRMVWSVPPSSPPTTVSEIETSSQDGDIEDEVDSDEEIAMRWRSPGIEGTKRSSKYRSIGVQTDSRELRDEGVQAMTFPITEVTEMHLDRNLSTSGSISAIVGMTDIPISSPLSPSKPESHPSLLPPNLLDYGTPSTPASGEAGNLGPSSVPSLPTTSTTAVGSPPLSRNRKGARVWDPARGVEAFKRGSEEVLTKFMKMGF